VRDDHWPHIDKRAPHPCTPTKHVATQTNPSADLTPERLTHNKNTAHAGTRQAAQPSSIPNMRERSHNSAADNTNKEAKDSLRVAEKRQARKRTRHDQSQKTPRSSEPRRTTAQLVKSTNNGSHECNIEQEQKPSSKQRRVAT
jgi:hypothetical protein